jgi:hypothetical protein
MAMTNLPAIFVPHAWKMLQTPPAVADPQLAQKLLTFADYFERTWISGSFPASLWTHYDHTGPRTTNNAEGWHNSINHSFGVSHPSITTFLNWLHKYQFEVQCRGLQLAAGRPAKSRAAVYVKLDEDIMQAKVDFSLRLGYVFINTFPNPTSSDWQFIEQEISCYLARVAYLSGII